ncbi:MFS multidrug transporter-like protein [Xylariales sp. PMI_506]|nr:MFS multidrug transporter-like protein [Xylariales sp. PMI_506]
MDKDKDSTLVARVIMAKEKPVAAPTRPTEASPVGEIDQNSDTYLPNTIYDGHSMQVGSLCTHDLEVGGATEIIRKGTTRNGMDVTDPNLVGWEEPDDPENPKNWPSRKRWAATLVMSLFTFITPVASSIVAPAFTAIGTEFHITSEIELSLMLSIFILAYAVGPLFLGPLSEIYGRVIVLQLSNLVFLIFNLACGLATSKTQMLAFRFFSGLGGSAPLAIGGGVLSDLFSSHERGKAVSIYSLAPLIGPALGPIAGGVMVEKTSWRWVFHVTTIADAIIQAAGLFLLQETYPPVLLDRKKRFLIKETGNLDLYTEHDYPDRTIWKTLEVSITRPFILLGTQPIMQVLAVYAAYLFGLMYLLLSTFPKLWETRYGESVGVAGLNYISLGLGFFLGTQICAPLQDRIFLALKARNNGIGKPEFRVPLMVPAAVMVPIGLFWYGWAAQAHAHWIVPNLGTLLAGAGIYLGFLCIQTYIVDSYTRYAASAIGAATVLRSLAGFGLPLFGPYMYGALNYGWGNSVLGFAAIIFGWPAPILLWTYGESLRARSTFASG